MKFFLLAGAFALLPLFGLNAAVIISGEATWTVNEGFANSLGWLDAYLSDSKMRPQVLNPATTSDAPYNRLSGSSGTLGTSTTPGFGYTGDASSGILTLTGDLLVGGGE